MIRVLVLVKTEFDLVSGPEMALLECTCGMVMSVSPTSPRLNCIRCGSTELRASAFAILLEEVAPLQRVSPQGGVAPRSAGVVYHREQAIEIA
jgi:hypothetical protein